MRTEVEEIVATCAPANNGAGPLWCYGAPLVVRHGDVVHVSAMETGADVAPLCNTRPRIYRKLRDEPWRLEWQPDGFREREPCPIVGDAQGRLFVTRNPSIRPPGTQYGDCDPHVLELPRAGRSAPPLRHAPLWSKVRFTDHSYRGVAADASAGAFLTLNIDAEAGDYHVARCDARRHWTTPVRLHFPIRACYPQVCLRGGEAHVLAIGDIVEPVAEWRDHKRKATGREWDYVFRRLFYARCQDIAARGFDPPLELENLDASAGHITNLDLWVGPRREVHALYLTQSTTPIVRDAFLEDLKLRTSLVHVVLTAGRLESRTVVMESGEGMPTDLPTYARLHSPDGRRLLAVVARVVRDARGERTENAVVPLWPKAGVPVPLRLREPFRTFFTNCERGGSRPSATLDLFGVGADGETLRYARVGGVG